LVANDEDILLIIARRKEPIRKTFFIKTSSAIDIPSATKEVEMFWGSVLVFAGREEKERKGCEKKRN
jgi:hypothetical protein